MQVAHKMWRSARNGRSETKLRHANMMERGFSLSDPITVDGAERLFPIESPIIPGVRMRYWL